MIEMASSTDGPDVIRVTQKGQATIPKALREKYGIDAPGEVFVYEDEGRIILEPVPTPEGLQGIHDADRDPGEILERVRELRSEEERQEAKRADRIDPTDDG